MHSNEGERHNPKRRYHDFRPRQAARGTILLSAPTNFATLSLFHNGPGSTLLVVRDFKIVGNTGATKLIARQQNAQGTSGGLVVPLLPGEGAPAGQLYSLDTATAITPDYATAITDNFAHWQHEFPFEVLLQGWSLVFQNTVLTQTTRLSIMWEAVQIDEIDYMDAG